MSCVNLIYSCIHLYLIHSDLLNASFWKIYTRFQLQRLFQVNIFFLKNFNLNVLMTVQIIVLKYQLAIYINAACFNHTSMEIWLIHNYETPQITGT